MYLQNLTGFAKGYWEPLPFTYSDLGLNETWTEAVAPPASATIAASTPVEEEEEGGDGVEVAQALAEQPVLIRRQSDTANESTSAAISPEPNVVVYNRTLQRGTFPWLDNSLLASTPPSSPPPRRSETHHATFNLRSLQTSATGPVLRPSGGDVDEDGHVLRVKDGSATTTGWQEWEKLGPVVYVGGKLTLHAPSRLNPGSGEDEVTELDVEAVQ